MEEKEAILTIENLRVEFTGPAVDALSFSLYPGEVTALVGESGSGKSVTALSLMGLLPQTANLTSGKAFFHGKNLFDLQGEAWNEVRGKGIAMIFQEPMTALNPVLTIGTQIGEAIRAHEKQTDAEVERRCVELLEEVGIPEACQRLKEYPHQFSGGMRQRVMIAIALACNPEILIADEPTTALDVTVQAQIMELLDELRRRHKMSVLLITHNLALAKERADRILVMYAGRLVESASREVLFSAPRHPYTRLLLRSIPAVEARGKPLLSIAGQVPAPSDVLPGCRFAPRCPFVMEECQKAQPPMREENGHCFACIQDALAFLAKRNPPQREGEEHAICLRVQGLAVHFPVKGGFFGHSKQVVHAVDNVDLELRRGETLALVGESGCGKTTVGKALVRLVEPTRGEILLGDTNLAHCSSRTMREMRRHIQMIFQDPYSSLDPRLTVGEILGEGLDSYGIATGKARLPRLKELLQLVGLPENSLERYPHQFSGGQRQRIGLARGLALYPEVLICDECTSALDVSVQAQVLNLLKELQAQLSLSLLFITHDLGVVGYLADRIAVMYLGEIVEEGTAKEILDEPAHPYTKALLSAAPQLNGNANRVALRGEPPSPVNPPSGCRFAPRCPYADNCPDASGKIWKHLTDTHRVRCGGGR